MSAAPSSETSRVVDASLRAVLWLLLGTWVGSWLLFGAVIAPTAFRLLPSETAGIIVGPTLTVLHLYGGVAGFALAALARALGRGGWTVALPLLLGAICLASHFGISLPIAEIRDNVFGSEGSISVTARFGRLHALSMSLFVGVGIGTLILLGLHAYADSKGSEAV